MNEVTLDADEHGARSFSTRGNGLFSLMCSRCVLEICWKVWITAQG